MSPISFNGTLNKIFEKGTFIDRNEEGEMYNRAVSSVVYNYMKPKEFNSIDTFVKEQLPEKDEVKLYLGRKGILFLQNTYIKDPSGNCPKDDTGLIIKYYATEKGQYAIDAISLKVPLFGMLLRKVAVAKFSRTFSTLIKSGVPVLQALDTVAKTSGNKVIEKAINTAKVAIKEGERMAPPLKATAVFPPMVLQMIAIGEETGNLDVMLNKIADFYDQEVDTGVKALTSMIEPLIMVLMGVVVGAIVLAMFMPMFEMSSLASK